MIKITANRITINRILKNCSVTLLLLSLFGLGACAPIVLPRAPMQLPHSYPGQQPTVLSVPAQRPQPVVQRVQVIPKAGALVAAPVPVVKVARAPAPAVRTQQPAPRVAPARTQQQARKITVPPVLNPVQQAQVSKASNGNNNRSNSYRPSASGARAPVPAVYQGRNQSQNQSRQPIWEDIPRNVAPARQKTAPARRPSAAVRRPAVNRKNTAVAKPAARVSQKTSAKPTASTQNSAQTQTQTAKPAQTEVLDLSGSVAKATPIQENKTASAAPPRTFSSSPAVAILTKQANNQLTVGKAGRAAATLERALRIEPENPLLWLRLAEVNAQQGKKSQAASMARKALNLAPGDARLQARGQRLLN